MEKRSKSNNEGKNNFGVFDFETYDWVKPLCIGVYHAHDSDFYINRKNSESVARTAVQLMLDYAYEYDVTEWWAHNGGKFDDLFILDAIKEMEDIEAEGFLANGRLISLKITEYTTGVSITLKDSYAVIQSKLEKALKDFEIPHRKSFDENDYQTDMRLLTDEKLERGCMDDCIALHALLSKASDMFHDWGGKLKGTFSASALTVVKAEVKIASHDGIQYINAICRQAYFGGRVEVFHHAIMQWLREYDVTSSYPWSMAQDLPWEFVDEYDEDFNPLYNRDFLSIVDATVHVPEMDIPPLPFSPAREGLFFPTGTWRGWFASNELEFAESLGCTVKVHQSMCYTRAKPFDAYIAKLFADKAVAKGARREFDKLCLNGSYGKLAQKPESEVLRVFGDPSEGIEFARNAEPGTIKVVSDDYTAFSEKKFKWPAQTHYAAASFITAYSRILLCEHLRRAKSLAYCDTDSIHCERGDSLDSMVNEELGGLKVELDEYHGRFYAPKLYELTPKDSKIAPIYASKGFPVNQADFMEVIQGNKVGRQRMKGAKAQLRQKIEATMMTAEENMKGWAGYSGKRKAFKDGSTRAWTVNEILDGKHRKHRSPLASK